MAAADGQNLPQAFQEKAWHAGVLQTPKRNEIRLVHMFRIAC